jgi:hypothetical protein
MANMKGAVITTRIDNVGIKLLTAGFSKLG